MSSSDVKPASTERQFGEFKCPKCNRKWMSENCWANVGQRCVRCRIDVFPYKQRPLENPDKHDPTKRHMRDLCGMCKKLGRNCTELE